MRRRALGDDAVDGRDLGGNAALEVLQHAGTVPPGRPRHFANEFERLRLGCRETLGARDLHRFRDQSRDDRPDSGPLEDLAGAEPEQRGHRIHRRVQDRLVPQGPEDVGDLPDRKPGSLETARHPVSGRGRSVAEPTQGDLPDPGVEDDAVAPERRSIVRDRADHRETAGGEDLLVAEPVLQRNPHRAPSQRRQRSRDRGRVVRLHAHEHEVGPEVGELGHRLARPGPKGRLGGSLHPDAVTANPGQASSTGDNGYRVPPGEARGEDASGGPGPEHEKPGRGLARDGHGVRE